MLGPGLGRREGSLELARDLALRIEAPLVIDADGLNAHAGRLESLRGRDGPTVLTPHAGELGRLLERSSDQIGAHRLAAAKEAAEASGAVVLLKGDDTIVTDGERVAVNARLGPGAGHGGHRRHAVGDDRGAAGARAGAVRRRLRRRARRRPRGPPRRGDGWEPPSRWSRPT